MKGGLVTWQGTTRGPLHDQDVVPHLESGPFPVWIGVGGSPESVIRAARYGFSLMLAIIGGPPARFAPFSQLFRDALREFAQPSRPVGVHAPGHVAETDEQAQAEFWPNWRDTLTRVSKERSTTNGSSRRFAQTAASLIQGSTFCCCVTPVRDQGCCCVTPVRDQGCCCVTPVRDQAANA
jgi:alkanesulfonate monooxygenase SsuD/methylene tetrahydromethanopterin reductase-like flavin-dependent oxidoreductase (luciferase family)